MFQIQVHSKSIRRKSVNKTEKNISIEVWDEITIRQNFVYVSFTHTIVLSQQQFSLFIQYEWNDSDIRSHCL